MRRWKILLGRSGTVLLAIGLALLLVSLIPAAQTGTSMGTQHLGPKRWGSWYYETILTPQQSLRLNVTANGTLNVYLLEVRSFSIYDWMLENYPDRDLFDFSNVTYLEEYLNANPATIGWQHQIQNGGVEYEYYPTKTTNATLVLSNPTSDFIQLEYRVTMTAQVAPRGKVQTLATWTIPIGFLLAIPWTVDILRARTKKD